MGKINHGLYERPFGRLPGIGLGLALFLYAAAVMLVLNRLIPAWLSEEASRRWTKNKKRQFRGRAFPSGE